MLPCARLAVYCAVDAGGLGRPQLIGAGVFIFLYKMSCVTRISPDDLGKREEKKRNEMFDCHLPTDGQLPTCCLPVPGVEWYKAWRIPPKKAKLTLVGWGAPS